MSFLGTLEGVIRGGSGDSLIIECQDCGVTLNQAVSPGPDCTSPNIAVYVVD